MKQVTVFGRLYVEQADETGYTRFTTYEGSRVATAEWVKFETALPKAEVQKTVNDE